MLAAEPLSERDGYGCQSTVSVFAPWFPVGHQADIHTRAPPSPNTLDAYKLAAAKTGISSPPPNIEGGVFISLNSTSTTGSTSTGSATASVHSLTSSSGVGSSSSSGNGGSSTGSGSGSGSQSSPTSFPGGAAKTAAGFIMLTLAAGGACLALF